MRFLKLIAIVVGVLLLPSAIRARAQQIAEPARPSFSEWLQQLRIEAAATGISANTLDRALNGLEPLPIVVERDRTQRELTLTVRDYVKRRVTKSVIRLARDAKRRHSRLLARVEKKYGVAPEVVVAVWALESNFGRFTGVRPTVQALSTLAWEGRRGPLFRRELIVALGILDRGEVSPSQLKGSWAGAMGQVQFLPSSFVRFAQDFDGDAQKDIWHSLPDVFASIANYLQHSGWVPKRTWGVPVRMPKTPSPALEKLIGARSEGCSAERDLSPSAAVGDWMKEAVKLGRALPRSASASLLTLGSASFLVTSNYEAILKYNCAHSYAMSVAELSDAIRGSTGKPTAHHARRPR